MTNEKKKLHFNFIDILIILAFVVVIIGFSYYATGHWQTNSGGISETTDVVRYTLHAEDVPESVAKMISEGDELKDASKDTFKGKIVKINANEKFVDKEAFDSINGIYTQSEHPTKYMVDFDVESAYVLSGNAICIDGAEVKVGKKSTYKSDNYALSAVVTRIEEIQR